MENKIRELVERYCGQAPLDSAIVTRKDREMLIDALEMLSASVEAERHGKIYDENLYTYDSKTGHWILKWE